MNFDFGTTKCSKPAASPTVDGEIGDTLLVAYGTIAEGNFDALLGTLERKLDSLTMTGPMVGDVL
jgi:hypothetical protein